MKLSLIIPTFNRPRSLVRCLESVIQLQCEGGFEVVVVDDGGHVDLRELIDSFSSSVHIRLLRQEHAGPAEARNNGSRQAVGEFLGLLDDDCTVAPDWWRAAGAVLERNPTAMVGGKTINAVKRNIFSEASHVLMKYIYSYYNADPEHARFFALQQHDFREVRICESGALRSALSQCGRRGSGIERSLGTPWSPARLCQRRKGVSSSPP